MLHLFMDAMDLLQLLERLDPTFQEHMRRARPRVLWAISQLQGWVKGIDARRNFRKRKDVVMQIQRRWRGVQTRRRLLGMLHMHKWRRRQVNTYFLPKTAEERRAVKQKCSAMLAAKDVTQRAANASLKELRDTIMQTAQADPLEDAIRTKETLGDDYDGPGMGSTMGGTATSLKSLPGAAQTAPAAGPNPYTTYDGSSRFGNAALTGPVQGPGAANLASKDPRNVTEGSLRQITRLDNTR